MPQPTQILRKEHEAISRMLDAADRIAAQLERREPIRPELLEGVAEFFELFCDKCHHGKEEELLFPFLAKKGLPVEGGPIGVMLAEHTEGRALAGRMKQLTAKYKEGDAEAGTKWAAAAKEYSQLLRQHILKENNVLFPMAEGLLSPAEEDAIAEKFEQLEDEKMGRGTHERLHQRMAEILKEVTAATAAAR